MYMLLFHSGKKELAVSHFLIKDSEGNIFVHDHIENHDRVISFLYHDFYQSINAAVTEGQRELMMNDALLIIPYLDWIESHDGFELERARLYESAHIRLIAARELIHQKKYGQVISILADSERKDIGLSVGESTIARHLLANAFLHDGQYETALSILLNENGTDLYGAMGRKRVNYVLTYMTLIRLLEKHLNDPIDSIDVYSSKAFIEIAEHLISNKPKRFVMLKTSKALKERIGMVEK